MRRVNLIILFLSSISFIIFPFKVVQGIAFLIISVYGFSFIISKIMYNSVSIKRGREIYYCKNAEDEVSTFTIKNVGIFPLDNIIIIDRGSGCYDHGVGQFLDTVRLRGEKEFSCKLNTNTRGLYRIGPVELRGSDPFNFFPWEKIIKSYCDVVIYPKYYDINLILTKGERGGVQRVKDPMYEDLSDLESMREYRSGDSLKRVNWKATARTGKIQTMEFSNNLSAPVFILMDISPDNYPIKKRYTFLERCIEASASIITKYSEKKEACGMLTHNENGTVLIPQSKGYSHTVSILESLAEIQFSNYNYNNILELYLDNRIILPTGTHFYILVPEINRDLLSRIELLRKQKLNIKLVLTGGGDCLLQPPSYIELFYLTSYGEDILDG